MQTIDATPSLMQRVRFALTFYRQDMARRAEPGSRWYPYGIDVENAVRAALGEPAIPVSDADANLFADRK